MELALPGRLEEIPEDLGYALMALRDACAYGHLGDRRRPATSPCRTRTRSASRRWPPWRRVHDVAERIMQRLGVGRRLVRARHDRFRRLRCGWPRMSVSGPAAGEAVHRPLRGPDLGDPEAGRRLQRRGRPRWASPRRAPRARTCRSGRASTSGRPSTTPSRASSMSPSTCPGPRRDGDRERHARRADRADPGGRRPHTGPVLLHAGGRSWPPRSCARASTSSRSSSRARRPSAS